MPMLALSRSAAPRRRHARSGASELEAIAQPLGMNESAFWRFSLAFYSRAGVPEVCLRLQDAHALDVNVMLYLLFLAANGRRIRSGDLERIEAVAAHWRETVVRPLRQVRRGLKTRPDPFEAEATEKLRNDVKRIELEAERLQQLTMEQAAAPATLGEPCTNPNACARHNLSLYAERLGGLASDDVETVLQHFTQGSAQGR